MIASRLSYWLSFKPKVECWNAVALYAFSGVAELDYVPLIDFAEVGTFFVLAE
jgi:hypothetical protein